MYGNKCQKCCELISRTFSFQALCVLQSVVSLQEKIRCRYGKLFDCQSKGTAIDSSKQAPQLNSTARQQQLLGIRRICMVQALFCHISTLFFPWSSLPHPPPFHTQHATGISEWPVSCVCFSANRFFWFPTIVRGERANWAEEPVWMNQLHRDKIFHFK